MRESLQYIDYSLCKQYDLNYIKKYTTDQTINFDRGEWGSQLCTVGGGHF